MYAQSSDPLTMAMPADDELVITRSFNAPRDLVWQALTRPEHVRRWYGPRAMEMTVCEIDLRPGGRWRYVLVAPDGSEHGFGGVYQELDPPARLISTEGYEQVPGHDYLVTVTLDEQGGKTLLTSHLRYRSPEDRAGHIGSGMEAGMRETYDRLDELLAGMA